MQVRNPELQIQPSVDINLATAKEQMPTGPYETISSRDRQAIAARLPDTKRRHRKSRQHTKKDQETDKKPRQVVKKIQRADELRRRFPEIQDIPAKVNRIQLKKLTKTYLEKRVDKEN